MKLDDLAVRFETDKSSLVHNYTERYEVHFAPMRNEPLRILELGIQSGASLKMWKAFFTRSHIFGLDIKDSRIFDEQRITTIKGSQTDVLLLEQISERYGPFDVIIDDASHHSRATQLSFDTLFPLLNKGGFYVIEDLHCCYWPEFSNGYSFIERIKELIDCTNANGKVGNANLKTTNSDRLFIENVKNGNSLTEYESSIEAMYLYRGIAFIKKMAYDFPVRQF